MERVSDLLRPGSVYTRADLGELLGYGTKALETGIFTPRRYASVLLFITKHKTQDMTQYVDDLTGDDAANQFRPGLGEDVVDGAGGFDILDYSDASGPVTLTIGADAFWGNTGNVLPPETNAVIMIEQVVMAAEELRTRERLPSRSEIRSAIEGTRCRCAGQRRLEGAVELALDEASDAVDAADALLHLHRVPGQIEVELRPDQLSGNEDAQGHANDTPDHRHDGELAYYLVVISCRSGSCAHAIFHG